MRAITIRQPWASLLVTGKKRYETRSWATSYRGPIAIHASAFPVRRTVDQLAKNGAWGFLERLDSLFLTPHSLDELPIGAIVATGILTRCNAVDEAFLSQLSAQETDLGDFSPGRFAWEFENITLLSEPVPAKGMLGLWEWEGGPEYEG